MQPQELGLAHFWQQADSLSHAVAYLLLAMSVTSWYFILLKTWRYLRSRRLLHGAVREFWATAHLDQAVALLSGIDHEKLFTPLAVAGLQAMRSAEGSLTATMSSGERVTRALREAIQAVSRRLGAGQTVLASIGSTAPFVGLFGTVWGIYHALLGISIQGQIQIEKIAGPVGEALVMTAAGLAVAIPAVLAYNAFGRVNRLLLLDIDGFAHDLQALLANPPTGAQ
ncbi:MAG: MotA/TolQ/ExbB proton channel family protein [Burkholderiaceae bacterium]